MRSGILVTAVMAVLMLLSVPSFIGDAADATTSYSAEITLDLGEYAEIRFPEYMDGRSFAYVNNSQNSSDDFLPPGMARDGDTISGTPTALEDYTVSYRFHDSFIVLTYDATLSLTIHVRDLPEEYKITYDAELGLVNGSTVWSETIIEGTYASMPPATHSSGAYTFLGWSLSPISTVTIDHLLVSGDVTLYAVWDRNTVLIQDMAATVSNGQTAEMNVPTDPSDSIVTIASLGGLPEGSVSISGHRLHLDMTGVPSGTYEVVLEASYTGYYTGSCILTVNVPIVIVEPISYMLSLGDTFSYTPVTDPSNATIEIKNVRFDGSDLPDSGCFRVEARTITGVPEEQGVYEISYTASMDGFVSVSDTVVIYVSDSHDGSDPVTLGSIEVSQRADEPRTFDFLAIGGGNIGNYIWSVDGEVFSSSSPTALHRFPTAGIYTVRCTVTGTSGDSVFLETQVVCQDSYHREAAWSDVPYTYIVEGSPEVSCGPAFSIEHRTVGNIEYTVVSALFTASDIGTSHRITIGGVSWDVTVYQRETSAPKADFTLDVEGRTVKVVFTGTGSFHSFDFDADGVPDGNSFTYPSDGIHQVRCTAVNNISEVSVVRSITIGPEQREDVPLSGLTDFHMRVGEKVVVSLIVSEGDVITVSGDASEFTVVDGCNLTFHPGKAGVFELNVSVESSDGTVQEKMITITVKDEIDYEQVSSDYHSALIVLFVAGIGCIIVFILLEMRSPRRPRGPTTHTLVPKGSDRGYRR